MTVAGVVVYGLALVTLAVAWIRGVLGHRTHRRVHMRLRGRTSDVAFHPEGWYPPVTYGCPRGDEDRKLRWGICWLFRLGERAALLGTAGAIVWGAVMSVMVTGCLVAGAELGICYLTARYVRWRVRWDQLCMTEASPLASILSYPFRLRAADIADEMTVNPDGRVRKVPVPTTFKGTAKEKTDVEEMITSLIASKVIWHLTARPPYLALADIDELPGVVLFADWVHEIDGREKEAA